MKKIALLLPLALLLTSLPCAAQGSLSPPGPPAPTMKTLDQIYDRTDPRTPISSLLYTISQPGAYYVVSNLHSTTDGIVIETSGVTVDLMGFSLAGDDSGSGDYGIHVAGATNALIDKVVIKNGTVTGFYRGLYCEYMNNSRIEQMVVSGNNDIGVFLNGWNGQCNGNTTRENTVSKNVTRGISLYKADGNRVEANHVSGTTGGTSYGILTQTTTGNFILKNTCMGQTNSVELDSDATYGPIVTNPARCRRAEPPRIPGRTSHANCIRRRPRPALQSTNHAPLCPG